MKKIKLGLFLPIIYILLLANLSQAKDWSGYEREARGQDLYFAAWGGSQAINNYISWAGEQLQARYGISLHQVKVGDIGEVVGRLLLEQTAGRQAGGDIDLIWINGENYAQLRRADALWNLPAELPPNIRYLDLDRAVLRSDFTLPTAGYELAWGQAQLLFISDAAELANPPKNMAELMVFCRNNPGRFTYPAPPSFYGTSLLKQFLWDSGADSKLLRQPVDEVVFQLQSAKLWRYLDKLHPLLWQGGKRFARSGPSLLSMLDNREILLAYSFNPSEAARAIANGELAPTVRTTIFGESSLANAHFLAIPKTSSAKAAALLAINFLLSPEAQARKANPLIWGDPTVIDLARLSKGEANLFSRSPLPGELPAGQVNTFYPEPHPSWTIRLEQEWQRRYGQGAGDDS